MGNSQSEVSPSKDIADSRVIVLNEVFSQQLSLIIIDYLNPLYGFQDGLFEMKVQYSDNQYWDLWEIYLSIDNKQTDNLFHYNESTKSIQTTAELLFINNNKQGFGPELILDKHLCTINISSIWIPTQFVNNCLNLSKEKGERKKDGTKWNREELKDKTHCICIKFDPVTVNTLRKDKSKENHAKYFRKSVFIPADFLLDYWMEELNELNKLSGKYIHWPNDIAEYGVDQFSIFMGYSIDGASYVNK